MTDKSTALKIWNTNNVGGIVGAFNVQGSKWDQRRRRYVDINRPLSVVARVKPSDVHATFGKREKQIRGTRYVAWSSAKKVANLLSSANSELALELHPREWDLVTIQEVLDLPEVLQTSFDDSDCDKDGGAKQRAPNFQKKKKSNHPKGL